MIYHQKNMTDTNPPTDPVAAQQQPVQPIAQPAPAAQQPVVDPTVQTQSLDAALQAATQEPVAAPVQPAPEAVAVPAPVAEAPAAVPVADPAQVPIQSAPVAVQPVQPAAQVAPVAQPAVTPPTPAQAAVAQAAVDGDKKRILIVEDERPLAHALELKLGHDGYQTTTARTGTEGLKQAQSGNYDLILLDLILPELDGFAILSQLRSDNNAVPVVILSNLGQEEDKQRVSQYSVAQYCVKSNMPLASIVNAVKTHAI